MGAILLALLPLLLKLLEALFAKQKSGKPLSARDRRQLSKVLGAVNRINKVATALGVEPDDNPSETVPEEDD